MKSKKDINQKNSLEFKYVIESVFPHPVGLYQLGSGAMNKKELNYIKKLKFYNNMSNKVSELDEILNNKNMADFRNKMEGLANHFFQQTYSPTNKNLKVYITQSWANLTDKGETHHVHSHQNSIISGVYYVDVDELTDDINFRSVEKEYMLNHIGRFSSNPNPFNSSEICFGAKNGMLLLFPSYLVHEVTKKVSDKSRYSLSFNTFLKGELGDRGSRNYLNLQ